MINLRENTDRDLLQQELDLLKERLAWEERMVKKGYLSVSQAQSDDAKLSNAKIAREKVREERRVLNDYEREHLPIGEGLVCELDPKHAAPTVDRWLTAAMDLAARKDSRGIRYDAVL